MNFSKQLNNYIDILNCSLKELADSSGLSSTVISRYRNGERTPIKESEQLQKLAEGIEKLAIKQNSPNINKELIISTFNNILDENITNFNKLNQNFNELISVLKINIAEMARNLNFDASYISRIRTGQRKPADPEVFINSVCNFIVQRYNSNTKKVIIANLIGCKPEDISSKSDYSLKLNEWFCYNTTKSPDYISDFLKKLDEFNLNEYIRFIHFDDIKIFSIPFQIPTSKNYYGIEEMKQGELDFFKSTVLSKSTNPVFMCSDMPMEDMAEDIEFGKKWMFAIAMMLKKGIHLNIIHNLDRPFKEMMLGLESWIPIYMTGQVSPYYLKGIQNSIYCHFNYVSGNVALTGECIKDFHNKGKYHLTNKKEDVSYYTEKANCLIKKANPLMEIYKADSSNVYNAFITANTQIKGKRHGIFSSLPIHTIPEEMLIEILKENSLFETDGEKIINFVSHQKKLITDILRNNTILDEITELSKEDFDKHPISLSLSGCFYEKKIYYTYEQYLKHLKITKKYATREPNYNIKINNKNAFKNIQIFIHEGNFVMISKDTNPTIHFVIRHTKLRHALENFVAPIIE